MRSKNGNGVTLPCARAHIRIPIRIRIYIDILILIYIYIIIYIIIFIITLICLHLVAFGCFCLQLHTIVCI